MTTYNLTSGLTATGLAAKDAGALYRPFAVVDFKVTPYVNGDILKLIDIPAYTHVNAVGYRLLRLEGATCTANDIGDSGVDDEFFSAIDFNGTLATTAASIWSITDEDFTSTPDYVQLLLGGDASNAKIVVFAWLTDFGANFSA